MEQKEEMVLSEIPEQKSVDEITVGELISTELFKSNLKKLVEVRYNRPQPQKGFRYKRDTIDGLIEDKLWNVNSLVTNYILGESRKSPLKGSYRRTIKTITKPLPLHHTRFWNICPIVFSYRILDLNRQSL